MATTHELTVDANTIALWHMNGTVGSAGKKDNAEGTAAYDISETGTPTTGNGFDGASNGNYTFDGSSNYCTVADASGLRPSSVTVEIWFKATNTNTGTPQHLIDKGDGSGDYDIFIGSSNTLNFRVRTNSTDRTVSAAFSDTTSWHYAVLTYGSEVLKGYLDGMQFGSDVSAPGTYNTTTSNISFGASSSGVQKLAGSVDECRISNTVRSANDISDYYNAAFRVTVLDTFTTSDPTFSSLRQVVTTVLDTFITSDIFSGIKSLITTILDSFTTSDQDTVSKSWTADQKTDAETWTKDTRH